MIQIYLTHSFYESNYYSKIVSNGVKVYIAKAEVIKTSTLMPRQNGNSWRNAEVKDCFIVLHYKDQKADQVQVILDLSKV